MKKYYSKIITLLLLAPSTAFAVNGDPMQGLRDAGEGTSLIKSDPNQIITGIINSVLTFLGAIFLSLILYGGFKWMTSRGNAEAVGEAKKIIGNSVIGLIIVVSAYAITYTVLELLLRETTGAGGGGASGTP